LASPAQLRRQADAVEAGGGVVRGGTGHFEAVDGLRVGGDAVPMDKVAGGLDDALARIVAAQEELDALLLAFLRCERK